jgi:hypothetical protein
MRKHAAEMDQTPFDGCVFHVDSSTLGADGKPESFTWLCWGKRTFTDAELAPSLADLKAAPLKRMTHNFLRFNTAPGEIDWFDDFSAVIANARLAGRFAKEAGCEGILFDDEAYTRPLFQYRKQRDAATRSWDEYAAQARRRGAEVMAAFQEGFPDVPVLLTFGHSLPWKQSEQGKKPLSEVDYGLLAPMLDGMIDAARGKSRIIDGYELAYGYKDPAQFDTAVEAMRRGALPIVADPKRYAEFCRLGFGIWLDKDWREVPWNDADLSKNYFTPAAFEASVRHALARTDEYVWIYSETPRWWSEEGKTVKLPAEYIAALERARTAASDEPRP